MKKWQMYKAPPVIDAQPTQTVATTGPVMWTLKCIGCWEPAEGLFNGHSFCRKCLDERLRTGSI